MTGAFGMLKVYEYIKEEEYLDNASRLLKDCLKLAFNDEAVLKDDGTLELGSTDTILNSLAFNNNPNCPDARRAADHLLVYADYYLLTIGNKLLELELHK